MQLGTGLPCLVLGDGVAHDPIGLRGGEGFWAMVFMRAVFCLLAVWVGSQAALAQDRDTVVVGMVLEPPHLDPTAGAAAAIDEVTYANIFEGLTRIDETGSVRPGLAERWEIADDGLTYTFHLRDNALFHDGTTFDSADVVFSLDRARGDASTNAQKGYFEPIEAVDAPTPTTVVVRLSQPSGLFLFHLGQGDAVIVAPESAATNRTQPIGTGPFRFVDWLPGDRITLERFPDYWGGPDAVSLAGATFRFLADPSAQVAAMLAGGPDPLRTERGPVHRRRHDGRGNHSGHEQPPPALRQSAGPVGDCPCH